jgi:predicted permease
MHDLRYGLRLLRRRPGFAVVAMLTMALGIGATTLLVSVAYGVLLKPLPWFDAAQLVRVTETRNGRTGRIAGTVSNGTFLAWREQRSTIEDLGGWLTQAATLTGAGDPVRVPFIPTTPGLLPILGVRPLIGRLFDEGEGATNQPGVVILSYGLWQERFGGRSEIVGDVVRLDDKPYTIVGVMPRDFAFPDREARAWTAWRVPPVVASNGALVGVIFRAIARLRAGATPEQAAAEATAHARRAPDMGLAARALFGATGPIDVSAVRELEAITADIRPALLVLLAGVALLLVTATANVASLQLAHATVRRREMAVRAAIGARQRHLVKQLLIENAIIGLSGGAGGLALAAALRRVLPSLLPAGFPRVDAVTLDLGALAFAFTLSVLASLAAGLLPAWHSRRVNLVATLSEDGVASISGVRTPAARTRALIMVGQVAITCLLLVGALLLTRSFVEMVRADRGYDPVNVLTARLPLPPGYPANLRDQVLDGLVDRLRAVAGVTHAAYSSGLPFVSPGGFSAFNMRSPRNPDVEIEVQATRRLVSPDYFAALRLRLIDGRTLSEADTTTTPPVVVVNRTFAREYLGERPIGVRIPQRGPRAGGVRFTGENAELEVVGVVDDMRQDGVDSPPQPEMFISFKQVQASSTGNFDPILVVRTRTDPALYVETLRSLVRQQAPTLALDSVMSMEDRVMTSLANPRLYALVLSSFGVFALLVAGVGLFGVLSFSVAQRRREFGVRAALGAQVHDIVSLVLRQALWIVAIGVLVGLAAALGAARWMSSFLYGITPYDAATFVAVPVTIVAIAAIACLVPVRRAAKVDPVAGLRAE